MTRNDTLLHLLKNGRRDEVRNLLAEEKSNDYASTFPGFMDQVLKEKKINRKQLAARSGLSQDYLYKLLRGDKKTNERDYALAICIAAGMNLSQTQHALRLLEMPTLDSRDIRSYIIILAIMDNRSIHETNEWLEKAGFFQLKISPDMPSSKINIISHESNSTVDFSFEDDEDDYYSPPINLPTSDFLSEARKRYHETSRQIEAEPSGGNAPFDFVYWGIICVEDEQGQKYYIEASYSDFGSNFIVLDEKNKKLADEWMLNPEEENRVTELEQYDSLEDTAASAFFRYFLIIDRETDKKVAEVMESVNDTKNYGFRYGCSFGKEYQLYCEGFNEVNPAEMLYLQIVEKQGGFVLSASHKSYYMLMEMGRDLYNVYFDDTKDPEYLFSVSKYEDIPQHYSFLIPIYKEFRYQMNSRLKMEGVPLFVSDDELTEDKLDTLLRMGAQLYALGEYEESLNNLLQAEEIIKLKDDPSTQIVVYYRIALTYEKMELNNQSDEYYKKAYSYKEHLFNKEGDRGASETAFSILANIAYHYMVKAHAEGDVPKATTYCKEVISLLDDNCTDESDWLMLSSAYTNLAGFTESVDANLAAEYGEKSIQIVVDHGLDRNDEYVYETAVKYNNHAWVLWNLLQSKEAEFYYRRAFDLFSGAIARNGKDEKLLGFLSRVSTSLLSYYNDTNNQEAALRLVKLLKQKNISL